MKCSCKSHLHVTAIATWCHVLFHVLSFVTKILYDLSKVIRANCNHIWYLWLKISKKDQSWICKFLVMKCLFTKLVSMGYDGSSVFQGIKSRWCCSSKRRWFFFYNKVHCFTHKTNLTMVNLLKLDLMCWLEGMFVCFLPF